MKKSNSEAENHKEKKNTLKAMEIGQTTWKRELVSQMMGILK